MFRIVLIALAAALAACNAVDVDNAPAGTADHSVYVIVNGHEVRGKTLEGVAQLMDQKADAAAAQKCGTMHVKVLRRAQTNINTMIMTFRCEA
jgi:hypothetical protein